MGKGEQTRAQILERAAALASKVGLEALSVGTLAAVTGLSKSGLYAHFGSKEELQLSIVQAAADRFEQTVVVPTLAVPRGEPRLRAYFENWRAWARETYPEGGCFFLQATAEFDDQPGRVRDALEHQQRRLLEFLAGAARRAIDAGHFRPDLDCEQFAFEAYAIAMGYHHALRMMRDPHAERRARDASEALFRRARATETVA